MKSLVASADGTTTKARTRATGGTTMMTVRTGRASVGDRIADPQPGSGKPATSPAYYCSEVTFGPVAFCSWRCSKTGTYPCNASA